MIIFFSIWDTIGTHSSRSSLSVMISSSIPSLFLGFSCLLSFHYVYLVYVHTTIFCIWWYHEYRMFKWWRPWLLSFERTLIFYLLIQHTDCRETIPCRFFGIWSSTSLLIFLSLTIATGIFPHVPIHFSFYATLFQLSDSCPFLWCLDLLSVVFLCSTLTCVYMFVI